MAIRYTHISQFRSPEVSAINVHPPVSSSLQVLPQLIVIAVVSRIVKDAKRLAPPFRYRGRPQSLSPRMATSWWHRSLSGGESASCESSSHQSLSGHSSRLLRYSISSSATAFTGFLYTSARGNFSVKRLTGLYSSSCASRAASCAFNSMICSLTAGFSCFVSAAWASTSGTASTALATSEARTSV